MGARLPLFVYRPLNKSHADNCLGLTHRVTFFGTQKRSSLAEPLGRRPRRQPWLLSRRGWSQGKSNSRTHAENDVSLTQTNVLGLTQTTRTYTELAALLRSQPSASRVFTFRMASTSAARAKVCEFCEFCVPNKNILARKILRKFASSAWAKIISVWEVCVSAKWE